MKDNLPMFYNVLLIFEKILKQIKFKRIKNFPRQILLDPPEKFTTIGVKDTSDNFQNVCLKKNQPK